MARVTIRREDAGTIGPYTLSVIVKQTILEDLAGRGYLHASKEPVVILIRHGETVRAYTPEGALLSNDAFVNAFPGHRDALQT
ncbi:MAG: hypothetical protein AAGE89_05580 [Pseudomonadota bacterium]